MDVTPLIPQGRQIIQGYGVNGFRVSGVIYDGAVIVFPEGARNWDAPSSFTDLSVSHFDDLAAQSDDLDVVLLGTGSKMQFFPLALRSALKEKGLVVDVMDSGAACRTYNVLMAEGRRIVAALMPL